MKKHPTAIGLLCAIFTILVWGSTFIFSKLLLAQFTPAQVMLVRFTLAYVVLLVLRPRPFRLTFQQNLLYIAMALTGNTLYFLAENVALTYTMAANVSIIVAAAPIFTAILAHIVGIEDLHRSVIGGFAVAFLGVILVVLNGTLVLKLNPKGDFLALLAGLSWAFYSVLSTRQSARTDILLATRRVMLYGAITTLPIVLFQRVPFPTAALSDPSILGSFLFLGVFGSGICYVLWNTAFQCLGVVYTNSFIYAMPFVTVLSAFLILGEPISPLAIIGAVLITAGMVFSKNRNSPPKPKKKGRPR